MYTIKQVLIGRTCHDSVIIFLLKNTNSTHEVLIKKITLWRWDSGNLAQILWSSQGLDYGIWLQQKRTEEIVLKAEGLFLKSKFPNNLRQFPNSHQMSIMEIATKNNP
jgi:hypothetical protein